MDFEKELKRFLSDYGKGRAMVLSSSDGSVVSSRMVSVIRMGGRFWFQTDKRFKKYRQIQSNGNVSLCIDGISIEGTAIEAKETRLVKSFLNSYKAVYPGSFEKYSNLDNEVFFEVVPSRIYVWKYIKGRAYIELYDLQNSVFSLNEYQTDR
ncbi:MAG: pyridoxamine 5'-phosphate oxidase family protein [Bacilli bacterium]|jgi:uncharacterized pyridoxamine 5'-phosphate oxidase family protein|nr:pyridoxamine 5'-phosphate oxidase family protein [Bacilli bacterium]